MTTIRTFDAMTLVTVGVRLRMAAWGEPVKPMTDDEARWFRDLGQALVDLGGTGTIDAIQCAEDDEAAQYQTLSERAAEVLGVHEAALDRAYEAEQMARWEASHPSASWTFKRETWRGDVEAHDTFHAVELSLRPVGTYVGSEWTREVQRLNGHAVATLVDILVEKAVFDREDVLKLLGAGWR